MSWSLIGEDLFTLSNQPLDGTTGTDGITVWSSSSGTSPAILSNECVSAAAPWVSARDVTPGAIGDQAAECVWKSGYAGPAVRMQTGAFAGCYHLDIEVNGAAHLFFWSTGGAPTLMSTVGGAGTFSSGDVARIEVVGTSIQALKNGSNLGSPVTDSTYSTGYVGLLVHNTAGNAGVIDTWRGYAVAGGGPAGGWMSGLSGGF